MQKYAGHRTVHCPALAGAASGALASTGVGIVGMVAGNAAISMAENAANQVIENKGFNNFDVGDMLIDGAIGGASGALGGAGKGTKHLTNLGKQKAFFRCSRLCIDSGLPFSQIVHICTQEPR